MIQRIFPSQASMTRLWALGTLLATGIGLVSLTWAQAKSNESAAKTPPAETLQVADSSASNAANDASPQAAPQAPAEPAAPESTEDKKSKPEAEIPPLSSGLIGSAHDFTNKGRVGRDLCMPCHTPHLVNAPAPSLDKRTDSTPPLRPWKQGDVELDGWSLMCLGCHDGITAPDVFTSAHAVTQLPRSVRRGGDMKKLPGHPVGTLYPLQAEKFHTRAAVEQAGLPLPEGRIQCVTCHDPHNTGRHTGLLQISNDRSRLCLSCHNL